MNKEVSFPIAKLLKEKGFDEATTTWAQHGDGISGHVEGKKGYYNRKGEVYTSLPTVDEVKWWLYDKHGIWICVKKDYHNGALLSFETTIDSEQGLVDVGTFATPEQAYEAAILYTLNNLI